MKEEVISFSYRAPKKKKTADQIIHDWNHRNGTDIVVDAIPDIRADRYPPRIRLNDNEFIDLSSVSNRTPRYSDYDTLRRMAASDEPLPNPGPPDYPQDFVHTGGRAVPLTPPTGNPVIQKKPKPRGGWAWVMKNFFNM